MIGICSQTAVGGEEIAELVGARGGHPDHQAGLLQQRVVEQAGLHQGIAVFEHRALVDRAFVRHFTFVDGRGFTQQNGTCNT